VNRFLHRCSGNDLEDILDHCFPTFGRDGYIANRYNWIFLINRKISSIGKGGGKQIEVDLKITTVRKLPQYHLPELWGRRKLTQIKDKRLLIAFKISRAIFWQHEEPEEFELHRLLTGRV